MNRTLLLSILLLLFPVSHAHDISTLCVGALDLPVVLDECTEDTTTDTTTDTTDTTEPVADEPVADEPVADEPVADEPVADEPVAEEPAVKWYPGHYIKQVDGSSEQKRVKRIINNKGVLDPPEIDGIMHTLWWEDLEGAKGNYDFSKLDLARDLVAAKGKRIIFALRDRRPNTECSDKSPAPDYVSVVMNRTTCQIAWWEPEAMDAYIALMAALAAKYDSDDAVAGVRIMWENTVGVPTNKRQELLNEFMRLVDAAGIAWERTPTFFGTSQVNDNNMQQDVLDLQATNGVGVSHPDTVPCMSEIATAEDEDNSGKCSNTDFPIYSIMHDGMADKVPYMPEINTTLLEYTETERAGFDLGVDYLKGNFIAWHHRYYSRLGTDSIPDNSTANSYFKDQVLPAIQKRGEPVTACPTTLNCQ